MKCSNCGAELSQGSLFCGSCGAPIQTQPAPTQPQYQAPVQPQYQTPAQPQYQAPVQMQSPVVQQPYAPAMTPRKVTTCRILALVMALLCAGVLVVGYFVTANTALYDIPVMILADEDKLDEFEYRLDTLADRKNKIDDTLEGMMEEGYYSNREIRLAEEFLEVAVEAAENPSVNNIQKLADALEDTEGTDLGLDSYIEIAGPVSTFLSGMLIIGLVWVLPLPVLAGLCKSKGLAIASLIYSVFYLLPLAGLIVTIVSIFAHAALISLLRIADKEYAAYRNSLQA